MTAIEPGSEQWGENFRRGMALREAGKWGWHPLSMASLDPVRDGAVSRISLRWLQWVTVTGARRSHAHLERSTGVMMCGSKVPGAARSLLRPTDPRREEWCLSCFMALNAETTHRVRSVTRTGEGESDRLRCDCGELFGGMTMSRLREQHAAHVLRRAKEEIGVHVVEEA